MFSRSCTLRAAKGKKHFIFLMKFMATTIGGGGESLRSPVIVINSASPIGVQEKWLFFETREGLLLHNRLRAAPRFLGGTARSEVLWLTRVVVNRIDLSQVTVADRIEETTITVLW
jgi:hypothetical protein